MIVLLAACNDYDVSHSKLIAEAESDEIALDDGGADSVLLRLGADEEAVDGRFSSLLSITVFAAQLTGSPFVSVMASEQTSTNQIPMTGFVELEVEDCLERCVDPDADGLAVTWEGDMCYTELAVEVASSGGGASVQVAALLELSFASNEAPGAASAAVE